MNKKLLRGSSESFFGGVFFDGKGYASEEKQNDKFILEIF